MMTDIFCKIFDRQESQVTIQEKYRDFILRMGCFSPDRDG